MEDETPDARLFGKPPFFTLITGSKNSGKSELCRYIIRQYAQDFSNVEVIAPTMLNGFYQKIIPESHIRDTYSNEFVQELLAKQVVRKKSGKPIHLLLIFDDILACEAIRFETRKANVLNTLFCANRHYLVSLVIIVQKMKGVPPLCRLNVDYVCFTRCMRSAWADIYEEYSGNADKKEFFKMLEESTMDYKILMYRAKVARSSEHYSCFRIPPEFLTRKFRLLY